MNVNNLLVVAATASEILPLLNHHGQLPTLKNGLIELSATQKKFALITGVGMVNTAWALGKTFSHHSFNWIINAGICGAFNPDLILGRVILVEQDTISEMGAEDGEDFIPYSNLGLGGTHQYRFRVSDNINWLQRFKRVNGITVNTVHGNDNRISEARRLYQPDVESMEGAAFFRACAEQDGNFIQLRAVSNRVEKRDKSKWNIELAVNNLNRELLQVISEIE